MPQNRMGFKSILYLIFCVHQKLTEEDEIMERFEAADAEDYFSASLSRPVYPYNLAIVTGITTACLSAAVLFMLNLQDILPGLAQQLGQLLPYEHKLWLLPTSIVLLFASSIWTMGHLRTSDHEVH